MALLTLVENAVRHGIDPSETGRPHRRRRPARRATRRVALWVADTGVGLSRTAGAGHGLANLRERLPAFYGADARLELHGGRAARRARRDRVHGRAAHDHERPTAADRRRRAAAARAPAPRTWRGCGPSCRSSAEARNGREAVELFDTHLPQVVFLDVHMPGLNGVEAARAIARRAQIVFVTAYEQYAVQAFEQGAIDYLVKPVDEARLADTVQRLQARLATAAARRHRAARARSGARAHWPTSCAGAPAPRALAAVDQGLGGQRACALIPVEQVVFLRSDEKYTLVVWDGGEALIRKTIRELADELDPERFAQVHRSVIVNLHRVGAGHARR